MENNEMMIFELIASSLIKELKEFISFNRNKQIITETTIKRRDLLAHLLKIKEKKELSTFTQANVNAPILLEIPLKNTIRNVWLCILFS